MQYAMPCQVALVILLLGHPPPVRTADQLHNDHNVTWLGSFLKHFNGFIYANIHSRGKTGKSLLKHFDEKEISFWVPSSCRPNC